MSSDNAVIDRRRKAFMLAKELGLDREDRLDLASFMLWTDVESWDQLDDVAIQRMLDILEGYIAIVFLKTGATPPLPSPRRRSNLGQTYVSSS